MDTKNTKSTKPKNNIHLDPALAEGIYSNLVMIAHSPEEFILDFIRVVPSVSVAKVKSRVIITPAHAKRLLRALKENISRYEKSYGEIPNPGSRDQSFHRFGGAIGEA